MLCKSANGFMVFIVYLANCKNFSENGKRKTGKGKRKKSSYLEKKACSKDNLYYVEFKCRCDNLFRIVIDLLKVY